MDQGKYFFILLILLSAVASYQHYQINELKEMVDECTVANYDSLEQHITELESKIDDLESKSDDHDSRIDDLETKIMFMD